MTRKTLTKIQDQVIRQGKQPFKENIWMTTRI